MQFVGQVALDPEVFGGTEGRLAYIFRSPAGPWSGPPDPDPDGGENAVVVQPGDNGHVPTSPLREGPELYRRDWRRRGPLFWWPVRAPCEYAVSLTKRQDPDQLCWQVDDPYASLPHDINDCKVGGMPYWIQDEAWPYPESRVLLLQLVWGRFPFELDLGDAGALYAFLSKDGRSGKLLWQCY
jgi:hypothetical protein